MAFIMPILRVGKLKLEAKELVRDLTAWKSSWAQTRPVLRITAPRTASGCDEAPDPGRPRRRSLGHCTLTYTFCVSGTGAQRGKPCPRS